MLNKNPKHFFLLGRFHEAVTRFDWNMSLNLDLLHYQELVRANEDINYWIKWQEATKYLRQYTLEHLNKTKPRWDAFNPKSDQPNIMIVLPNFSGLAHEQQFGRSLKRLRNQYNLKFSTHILYLT